MKTVDEITIEIGFDIPEERKASQLQTSLIDLLSAPKPIKKQKNEPVVSDEVDNYFGDYEKPKKKKKDKTKKEKKDNTTKKEKKKKDKYDDIIDVLSGGSFIGESVGEVEMPEESMEVDGNFIDMDEIFGEEEDEIDGIIGEQKRGYKSRKKEEGYKKEFAEELTLLYDLLDETKSFGVDLEKMYKGMTGGRTRGYSKYTNDLINSILQSKQSKLSILKEIANVKKTIVDLQLKESKNNSSGDDGNNVQSLAASYLSNIVKTGRNNFVNALTEKNSLYDGDNPEIQEFVDNIGTDYSDDELQNLNNMLDDDLEDNDSDYRSAKSDIYIKYENQGVQINIARNIETGDWRFIAIDKFGSEITEYPLPDKQMVTPIKFNEECTFGTDKMGRSYKVIEMY